MAETLQLLIQAGNPIISIETTDEPRAVDTVRAVAGVLGQPLFEWSMTNGLQSGGGSEPGRTVVPPGKVSPALLHICEVKQRAIYLFKDLGPHCKDALVHRTLRDIIEICEKSHVTIILVDALP